MSRVARTMAVAAVVAAAITVPAVTLSATTPEHGYVTKALEIPETSAQANAFGRDINGDGHVDNQLGGFFAALAGSGFDFALTTRNAVANGDLVMLHALRARSFRKTRTATWQVFYAKPTPSPDFSGSGSFTVDNGAPRSLQLKARIRKGHVTTVAGTIPLELAVGGGGVITLSLQKAVIYATCSRSTCSRGRITGVISESDVQNVFLPQLAAQFTAMVARDCPGADPSSCVDASEGKALDSLFDSNHDLTISTAELQQNTIIKALLAPDIRTRPKHQPDALSAGFGFAAVKARLVRH